LIIDSGCTNHTTRKKRMFSSYEKNDDPQRAITFGDGNQGLVKGLGKIAISPDHSMSNVFLVDSLDYNLLSVSQLCKMGYNCLFTDVGVTIFRRSDDSIAFNRVLDGQLYLVNFNDNNAELDTCLIAKTNMGCLWHLRLAHIGMKNLHKLLKREHILGLTNVHFEKHMIYSACQAGKQVGVHRPHKNIMTIERPLELLHMDLFDPVAYISIGGSKYCLVIEDDYSRFIWVLFLQEKSQTQETLKKLEATMERSSRTLKLKDFLRRRASSMSSLPSTHLNKTVLWRERIELFWIWQGPCLMNTRHRIAFGLKRLTLPATPSTDSTFTESSRKHHMNSSLVKGPMFIILEFLGANALFLLKEVEIPNLLLKQ
jgi:hypothetical protein